MPRQKGESSAAPGPAIPPHELDLIENNGRRWCKVCGVEVL